MRIKLYYIQYMLVTVISIQLNELTVMAQDRALSSLPGTIRNPTLTGVLKTAPDLNKLKETDRKTVTNSMDIQFNSLIQTPTMQSFKGMETRIYGYGNVASQFQERTSTLIKAMFYPFTRQYKTGKITPVDEAPATLSIITNNLEKILFNIDGFWDRCNKINFPQFFEKLPISDSTQDYVEVKVKNWPYRIIQLNDKPIFIPLTRKEFIQFLIEESKQHLDQFKKIVKDSRKRLQEEKETLKQPLNTEMKKLHETILKNTENGLTLWEKNVSEQEQALQKYHNDLLKMTPEDAAEGAFINYEIKGKLYDQLSPSRQKNGTPLYKVNPLYFNSKISRSAAQVIIVTYWHSTGNIAAPENIIKYTKNIFNELDYHQLKTVVK